jgi:hypothetical protein
VLWLACTMVYSKCFVTFSAFVRSNILFKSRGGLPPLVSGILFEVTA